ncbi:MAG: hypothetical protein LBF67_08590 [Prevotellaceae bacterium]|nr:hypothetical protein [Prevotellaceae bacterium]
MNFKLLAQIFELFNFFIHELHELHEFFLCFADAARARRDALRPHPCPSPKERGADAEHRVPAPLSFGEGSGVRSTPAHANS